MKKSTQIALKEVSRLVCGVAIPVRWKSLNPLPGQGERKSSSRGPNGYELDSRQPYEPGDDPRQIDWVAYAQGDEDAELLTIHNTEPRDIPVKLIVNVSRSMFFGADSVDKIRLAAECVGAMVRSAEKTEDRVEVITHSETRIEVRVGPSMPKTAFIPAIVSVLEAPEDAPLIKGKSGLIEALRALPSKRSLVFLVSDFINLSDEEKVAIKRAASAHDVICAVTRDDRERELPPGTGFRTLEDVTTGQRKTIWLSATTRAQFAQNAAAKLAELLKFFRDARCEWRVFYTSQRELAIPEMLMLFTLHRQ
ncbi:MAG: DUF58 domain-containing protein [Candidatus Obscuribacterales bacterium]|nr:DUF58 domain-containing protein [Candidatus Obscuribacterales bacterium]